jgi:putative oxidoreductase
MLQLAMKPILGRFAAPLYAILRVVAGLMFMLHGTQKIFAWPGGQGGGAQGLMQLAGIIELVCGALIAVGLLTSLAALLASGEMAVAYFTAHFPKGPLPLLNDGELAVLYCFLFLYIAAAGAGIWSIDSAIARGKRR